MSRKRKSSREKDLTSRYLSGGFEEDRVDQQQRFNKRSKFHQQNKTARTTAMRVIDDAANVDLPALPVARVIQVHSLYVDVQHEGRTRLCVIRKTLNQVSDTSAVVGDFVRLRLLETRPNAAADREPEGVIEAIEPRKTILTRSDSFKAIEQHPIVANAEQMLIVASLALPTVKWGLIDRMIIASQAGGLTPILCLNKMDLAKQVPEELTFAREALAHYQSMGISSIQASVETGDGIEPIRTLLNGKITVLAGHSGVGKSSLIRAVQPGLDLKIGAISNYNQKGRHTTTSARIYPLEAGGDVIDTPGVKLFGLWNVTRDNLLDYFPDIEAETAPEWRQDSFARIEASLPAI